MWYKNAEEFKEQNGYEVEGTWYPRVTRITGIKAKPALEGFLREMESYAAAEEVKQKSAQEGSLLHDIAEKFLIGETPDVSSVLEPSFQALQNFVKDIRITIHPEFVERRIWSYRHKYAGTVDALAEIHGRFGVLDIKTSPGFYPEYNLQTVAYVSALQEFLVKKSLNLSRDIQTRWILRIDQHKICKKCGVSLREKGGRSKIRNGKIKNPCIRESDHQWGDTQGEIELKEFPYTYKDMKAFIAAKTLWEWENEYWLRHIGYAK